MSKLKIQTRELVGKQVKNLRKQGHVPAALYGPSYESTNGLIDTKEFAKVFGEAGYSNLIDVEIEGHGAEKVLVKEVQIHPLKDTYLHASLYVVDKNKEITTEVPLQFTGLSPAEDLGLGFVAQAMDSLTIRCLPHQLPSEIVVDISVLVEANDTVTVSDLKLPEGVELDSSVEATSAIAYIAQPQKVEDLLAEAAEGEAAAEEGAEEAATGDQESEQAE